MARAEITAPSLFSFDLHVIPRVRILPRFLLLYLFCCKFNRKLVWRMEDDLHKSCFFVTVATWTEI